MSFQTLHVSKSNYFKTYLADIIFIPIIVKTTKTLELLAAKLRKLQERNVKLRPLTLQTGLVHCFYNTLLKPKSNNRTEPQPN